jgi:hypothetical protein
MTCSTSIRGSGNEHRGFHPLQTARCHAQSGGAARGLLENTFKEYKRLGVIVRDARNGGLIDWNAVEDRTREVNTHPSWDSPAEIVGGAAAQYREDLWAAQRYRPEVWIEKNALIGVIEDICTELRVPYFATIGNNSQTFQYQAGKRFKRYFGQGLIPLILHLADHDPNGIDMTRDNIERLALYARQEVEVRRIALNLDQVREHNPPPSFVKDGDTRTSGYRERFGTDECWELDALSPTLIADLIRTEIEQLIDRPKWRSAQAKEERRRGLLDTKCSVSADGFFAIRCARFATEGHQCHASRSNARDDSLVPRSTSTFAIAIPSPFIALRMAAVS